MKWAGSKRSLLPKLLPLINKGLSIGSGKFHEPFAGGASVTLALSPQNGRLSDCMPEIVNLYQTDKKRPLKLHSILLDLVKEFGTTESGYYQLRDKRGGLGSTRAARMIYLNKVGFNGLYRTNSNGEFNVPFGRKANGADPDPKWPTLEDFLSVSKALKNVEITCETWQDSLSKVKSGDTVYVDPPYEGCFTGYGPKWTSEDHDDLAFRLKKLALYKNVNVITSQPDNPKMMERYAWCQEITKIEKRYAIGGSKERRKNKGELICIYFASVNRSPIPSMSELETAWEKALVVHESQGLPRAELIKRAAANMQAWREHPFDPGMLTSLPEDDV